VCALHRSLAEGLLAAGYGPELDAPLSEADVAGRRRLFELEIAGERFLVRRFTHGGLLRWLTGARFLDAERPFREIVLSERLRAAGLPTPLIAAARARRLGGAGWSLEVVTRRIEGTIDLGRALAGEAGPLGPARATHILSGAGRLVREMHEAGFFHADLTPRNLLVERAAVAGEVKGTPRTWILDLDRSEFRVPLGEAERLRNLRRLYRHVARLSSEGHLALSRGDHLRFLRGYEPGRAVRKDLWRRIRRDHDRRRAVHAPGWALERRFRGGTP
jgi:hypothetical protein